jgi:hypothetical protein
MDRKINIIWVIFLVILSGIFGYYTSSYKFFDFKYEIDIVNLLTLIVTSFIGIYIASSLQKNIDANKYEKNLVIENIKPITSILKNLIEKIRTTNLKFDETIKAFKDVSFHISEFEELNTSCDLIENKELELIRSEYLEVKTLVTNAKVENEVLVLDKLNVEKRLEVFRKNIVKLLLKVNRA